MPDCTCPWVPEHLWTRHYGAVEPGSQREFDPFCPVHRDALEQTAVECGAEMQGFQCGLHVNHGGGVHLFHDEDLDYYVYWPICSVSAGGTQVSLSKQDVDGMWPDSPPKS